VNSSFPKYPDRNIGPIQFPAQSILGGGCAESGGAKAVSTATACCVQTCSAYE